MPASSERLDWLDPPESIDAACPVCANAVRNEVFLRVYEGAQSVKFDSVVEVARCGGCASAWFPSIVIGDSYPAADVSALTDDFWLLIDHYVELVGGLDWKVALVERLPRDGMDRWLEVGCNTGLLLDLVHRLWNVDIKGLEPSAYGLAGVKRFGLPIESCYMGDLLPSAVGKFDVVLSTEVIEHVDDPRAFLDEMRALVRPGGMALITTPNADGLTPCRTHGEMYAMLSVGAHRMVLSADQLGELARQAGFASAQVLAEPTSLKVVLADVPVDLAPLSDSRPALLAYHTNRLADRDLAEGASRSRLADLIARYVIARELNAPDALSGESEIDELLRTHFDVDVLDLTSLINRVQLTTNIFEFGRLGPFSLAGYLFQRGHRDDVSEQARTEMWEAAVTLIGHGMLVDVVQLNLLGRTLDVTLAALSGRPSGRWSDSARTALAHVPELRDRTLPRVREPTMRRIMRATRRTFAPARP